MVAFLLISCLSVYIQASEEGLLFEQGRPKPPSAGEILCRIIMDCCCCCNKQQDEFDDEMTDRVLVQQAMQEARRGSK